MNDWLTALAVLGVFAIAGAAMGGREWFADWLLKKIRRRRERD